MTQPLTQVLLLLAAAVLVVALARRLGLPAIVGYLVVGMLLGPFAFALIEDAPATRGLAEIGVVFLLFTGLLLWDQGRHFVETALGFQFSIDAQRWATLLHSTAAIATTLMRPPSIRAFRPRGRLASSAVRRR